MCCVNPKRKHAGLFAIFAPLMFASLVLLAFSNGIHIDGIDPPEGYPGTKVRAFGGGATPNGVVEALFGRSVNQTVFIGNDTIPIVIIDGNMTVGWTTADNMGYWEIIFAVPEVLPGNYTIYVINNETLSSDSSGFGVLWNITIVPVTPSFQISRVSPSAGPSGTVVQLCFDGASGGEVRIYFNGISIANVTAYYWSGYWSGCSAFHVPDVAPGNYTITALDVASNKTSTAMFTVTPPAIINVSPSEAAIGSKITISGERFSPRTQMFLTFEDLLFFTPIYTNEEGRFNATIFVPVVNSGNYTIKAVGAYYYEEGPKALANVSFRVTMGLDMIFKRMDDIQNALNQTQGSTQLANEESSAAKENAQSAQVMAGEARMYALAATVFAVITAVLCATMLFKKR